MAFCVNIYALLAVPRLSHGKLVLLHIVPKMFMMVTLVTKGHRTYHCAHAKAQKQAFQHCESKGPL